MILCQFLVFEAKQERCCSVNYWSSEISKSDNQQKHAVGCPCWSWICGFGYQKVWVMRIEILDISDRVLRVKLVQGGEGASKMSSSAAASSYWRVAGMNYLKYANLCAGQSIFLLSQPKSCMRLSSFPSSALKCDGRLSVGSSPEFCMPRVINKELFWFDHSLPARHSWCMVSPDDNEGWRMTVDMVRASLKEPAKAAAKQRETVYFRSAQWAEGKPTKQGKEHWHVYFSQARQIYLVCLHVKVMIHPLQLQPKCIRAPAVCCLSCMKWTSLQRNAGCTDLERPVDTGSKYTSNDPVVKTCELEIVESESNNLF